MEEAEDRVTFVLSDLVIAVVLPADLDLCRREPFVRVDSKRRKGVGKRQLDDIRGLRIGSLLGYGLG
jgi:hypothetical protein